MQTAQCLAVGRCRLPQHLHRREFIQAGAAGAITAAGLPGAARAASSKTIDAQVHAYERNHPGRPWAGTLVGPEEMTLAEIPIPQPASGEIRIANRAAGVNFFDILQIQGKYQERGQKMQQMQQEIQSLNDQVQRQTATLSDDERLRLTRQLDEKQKIFKRAQELQPESWCFKRQAWALTDAERFYGTSFQKEVKALGGRPYYTPLDLGG